MLRGSISYILSETFNWKVGFSKSYTDAKQFYIIIGIAMSLGVWMQLLSIHPVKALLVTTIIYGAIAPVLISIIIHICNNKKIMGNYCNNMTSNLIVIITLTLLSFSVIALFYTLITGYKFNTC